MAGVKTFVPVYGAASMNVNGSYKEFNDYLS